MRNQKLLPFIYLLACIPASAAAPAHQVFAQLHALAVNYDVESDAIHTTIYATNHEDFAVICDASTSNEDQEKQQGQETRIEAHKTSPFKFKHRKTIKKVSIYLVCIPTPENKDKAAENASKSSRTIKILPETEKPPEPAVQVEELGNP